MVIDIIDLGLEQYSNLSRVQLAMVRAAQAQKNEILAIAEREKKAFFTKLLTNNVARSSILDERHAEIDAEAQKKVAVVRNDLIYQIDFEEYWNTGDEEGEYRYPERPNYNFTAPQRFIAVRNYYMRLTSDPEARLQAYSMDTLARAYLGEYYETLYDLLASYCE